MTLSMKENLRRQLKSIDTRLSTLGNVLLVAARSTTNDIEAAKVRIQLKAVQQMRADNDRNMERLMAVWDELPS